MAPPTITPDKNTLERWRGEGLTHAQMAQRVYETTGQRVTRSAISAAFVRHGLSANGNRHREAIPWRVKEYHAKAYPVRMLRLLSRTWNSEPISDIERRQLERWQKQMTESKSIVAYDPDSDQGFIYIDRKYKDHRGRAPIRRATIRINKD